MFGNVRIKEIYLFVSLGSLVADCRLQAAPFKSMIKSKQYDAMQFNGNGRLHCCCCCLLSFFVCCCCCIEACYLWIFANCEQTTDNHQSFVCECIVVFGCTRTHQFIFLSHSQCLNSHRAPNELWSRPLVSSNRANSLKLNGNRTIINLRAKLCISRIAPISSAKRISLLLVCLFVCLNGS